MNTIKVKLNTHLLGVAAGTLIELGTKKYPLGGFWGRRLTDSAIDGCLTIVKDEQPKSSKSKKKERFENVDQSS